MKKETIEYLQQVIHQNNVEKGFWEQGKKRSKGEMVMLMVSELSECLEAHRVGKRTTSLDAAIMESYSDLSNLYTKHFPERIKNTVEDEMADVVIRILDYCYGWQLPIIEREYRKESTGNLGHNLLRINWYIINAFNDETGSSVSTTGKDWGYVLASIEAFCDWYNFDLQQHIIWKLKYNQTRPYKHNKSY